MVSELSSMTRVPPMKLVTGLAGAFLAAVGVGVILSCGYALLQLSDVRKETGSEFGSGLLFIATNAAYVSAVMASLAIALLALPHVIVSQRLRYTSKKYYVLSGIVIGLVVIVVAEIWQRRLPAPPFHMGSDQYFFAVSAIAAGAVSALTYWSIARPDRVRH
jgi:hypothetical protein